MNRETRESSRAHPLEKFYADLYHNEALLPPTDDEDGGGEEGEREGSDATVGAKGEEEVKAKTKTLCNFCVSPYPSCLPYCFLPFFPLLVSNIDILSFVTYLPFFSVLFYSRFTSFFSFFFHSQSCRYGHIQIMSFFQLRSSVSLFIMFSPFLSFIYISSLLLN